VFTAFAIDKTFKVVDHNHKLVLLWPGRADRQLLRRYGVYEKSSAATAGGGVYAVTFSLDPYLHHKANT